MQNTNQSMQQFKPDNIVFPLIKLAMCLLACSHAFEIIMLFFKIGQMVTHKITGTIVGNFGEGLDFTNIVQPELERYELGDVMAVVGYSAMLLLAKFATWIIGIFIYIRVIFWFLEIYVMSCAAPVPYAMWTNKEWQQVSVNYTRKMLSTMFQGPLMLMLNNAFQDQFHSRLHLRGTLGPLKISGSILFMDALKKLRYRNFLKKGFGIIVELRRTRK